MLCLTCLLVGCGLMWYKVLDTLRWWWCGFVFFGLFGFLLVGSLVCLYLFWVGWVYLGFGVCLIWRCGFGGWVVGCWV